MGYRYRRRAQSFDEACLPQYVAVRGRPNSHRSNLDHHVFLRTPNVDLTPRVKPFVQADGINMQDAEVPPGEYTVRVDIKDSDGRPGTAIFTLKVAAK